MNENKPEFKPKPPWLKVSRNTGETNKAVMDLLKSLDLHTVCEEANCPNCGECFGRKTATFMILGKECTRNCTFCCVGKGNPTPIDALEPANIALAVAKLNLRYVVITSVTRDDLSDGGAGHFANVICALKNKEVNHLGSGKDELLDEKLSSNRTKWDCEPVNSESVEQTFTTPVIEVLIPDFQGDIDALRVVVNARPDVINHNIETVSRLYDSVRPQAKYERTLELLSRVKSIDPEMLTKSGIMVGLGESKEEVLEVFADLRKHKCDFLTIGQYLAPSAKHHPVVEYITPEEFDWYRREALKAGFSYVASGPLVRSSYQAEQGWKSITHY